MALTVRRYTPADEDALFLFREKMFPDGHKSRDRAHFRWKFLQHPYAIDLPFFIMEDNNRVVGTQGYWPFFLNTGDRTISCGHLVDFDVEQEYRGFPTLRLFKAVCSCSELNFGAYLSFDARRFFSAADWIDVSPHLKNYYCYLRRPPKSGLMGSAKYLCRSIWNKTLRKSIARQGQNCTFRIEDSLPHQADNLLSIGQQRSQPCFIKERKFMVWRYDQSARIRYQYASLYRDTSITCFLVFNRVVDSGMASCFIMDIIYDPDDLLSVKVLIVKLIEYLQEKGSACVVQSAALPITGEVFKSCGFSSDQSASGFMFSNNYQAVLPEPALLNSFNFILGDTDFL